MSTTVDERVDKLSISKTLQVPVRNISKLPPASSNLAINNLTSNLSISNGVMWYPLLPSQIFIFRPNYIGTPLPNTYTSWYTLYSDLLLTQGTRIIMFEKDGGSIVIPISQNGLPYELAGVVFYKPLCVNVLSGPNNLLDVTLANGVQFNGVCSFDGPIDFHIISTTVPVMVSGSIASPEQIFSMNNGFAFTTDPPATQPFLRIPQGQSQAMIFGNFASFANNAGVSVIDIQGSFFTSFAGNSVIIPSNSISGSGGSSIWQIQIFNKAGLNMSLAQSSYLGLAFFGVGDASNIASQRISSTFPTVNDDASQGIFVGTIWLDTSAGAPPDTYICKDNTVGSAVWSPLN